MKELLGILLFDVYRYEIALARKSNSNEKWLAICNRAESLTKSPQGWGVKCDWRWTSKLHAVGRVPSWGRRLMQRALGRYPIIIAPTAPEHREKGVLEVSFIIGHRGRQRLPLLLRTLDSIANQLGGCPECIVVEESFKTEIASELPAWVSYIHLETASEDQPYNRSRTFNAGAKKARGKVLVFHDNDMLVPTCYAAELLKHFSQGHEVINLKRFIFYLTEKHTNEIVKSGRISFEPLEFVLQNLTGGGSLAVARDAFARIGGFDEGFVGWGGEDVEFWDRAQVLQVNNYGYLPFIHLWHAPQPEKNDKKDSAAMRRLGEVLTTSRNKRIESLRAQFQRM